MDNSAYRLLHLLEKAKGHPETTPCINVWKAVFEVTNNSEVPGRLGLMLCLADQAAAEIIEVDPSSANSVNHWRNQILGGLISCNLHSLWKEFSKYIDLHSLQYLHLQAKLLNNARPKSLLDVAELSRARDKLSEALDAIRRSDLSASTKIIIVDRIKALIDAIDDYQITGQELVFDAFKLAGVDLLDSLRNHPDIPGGSALREGLSIVADLMTIAASGVALGGPVMYLVEHIR